MKKMLLQVAFVLVLGMTALSFFPNPAQASITQPPAMEVPAPQPVVVLPVEQDFSDADFETADQADLGALAGGDTVVVTGGVVVVVVLVVVLLILI